MYSIEYLHNSGDDYVTELIDTGGQVAERYARVPYRHIVLTNGDGVILSDNTDTETVRVSVVDGLEVARGTDPAEATVLAEDHTATVEIDGSPVEVSITDGSGTKEITTTKSAGSTISVEAVGLDGVPVESSNRKTIEVTN